MKRRTIMSRQYRRLLRQAVNDGKVTADRAREFRLWVTDVYHRDPGWAPFEMDPPWTSRKCCPLALSNPCVCAESWTCPVHGDIHIGTHD